MNTDNSTDRKSAASTATTHFRQLADDLNEWVDESHGLDWVVREDKEVKDKDGNVKTEEKTCVFKTVMRFIRKTAAHAVTVTGHVFAFVAAGVGLVVGATASVFSWIEDRFNDLFPEKKSEQSKMAA